MPLCLCAVSRTRRAAELLVCLPSQALDERRLVYELDDKGTIVSHVSITASATLFGFEPEGVVGRSMMSILDIMAVGDTLRYSKSGACGLAGESRARRTHMLP